MRFPLEVFRAVRAVWPADKPISVRISANDWVGDGRHHAAGRGRDRAHAAARPASTSSTSRPARPRSSAQPVYGRMFQTPFSDRIRNEAGIATHGGRQHLRARSRQLDPDGGPRRSRAASRGRISPIRTGRCTPRPSSATTARPGRSRIWPGRDQLHRLKSRPDVDDGEGVMGSLDGRHALITGGGTGIGAASPAGGRGRGGVARRPPQGAARRDRGELPRRPWPSSPM